MLVGSEAKRADELLNGETMLDDMKNGVDAFCVDRWLRPPAYDAAHTTVRWIAGLHGEDGTHFVDAVEMTVGRHGDEKFTLASNGKDEAGDYTFDKGFRFQTTSKATQWLDSA